RLLDGLPDGRAHLDSNEPPPQAVLHRLGQTDTLRWAQDVPTRPDAWRFPIPIGRPDCLLVRLPPIRHEGNADLPSRPLPCGRDHSLSQSRLAWATGPGDDEAARTVDAHAAPPFAGVLVGTSVALPFRCLVPPFFPTKDHSSSTSTSVRCRSRAR